MGECGAFATEASQQLTAAAVNKFNIRKIPSFTVMLSFKLTVGRVTIAAREMVTNEAIAHFRLDDKLAHAISHEYLYCYLKDFNYDGLGSTSSIATAVNSKMIKAMPVIVPSVGPVKSFKSQVGSIFELILNNTRENETLSSLRDTLLSKLMSGEIRVRDAEKKVEAVA